VDECKPLPAAAPAEVSSGNFFPCRGAGAVNAPVRLERLAPATAPAELSSRNFFRGGGAGVVGAPARLQRLEPAPACVCAAAAML
jgi:hypothetical protein